MSAGAPRVGVPGYPGLAAALHPLDATPPPMACEPAWLDTARPAAAPWAEAAVLVGLVPRHDGTRVLLTRRSEGLRHHGGQVSFPGGQVEAADGSAIAAALRETQEEVGLRGEQITPLGLLDPLLTITGFRIVPVVALLDPGYVARPDPVEVAEVFEVPLAFLLDPHNLHTLMLDYRGLPRPVLEYRYPTQRIWGATASILLNLRQRIEGLA